MMIKLRSKKPSSSSSKLGNGSNLKGSSSMAKIEWELRPGGMLVQKRDSSGSWKSGEGTVTVRVSYGARRHDIPIEATSTVGELKMSLSLVTGLEPREQRVLFRGKEREDTEHLHMVGVGDGDKVLLLEDPAIRETKNNKLFRSMSGSGRPVNSPPFRTISV